MLHLVTIRENINPRVWGNAACGSKFKHGSGGSHSHRQTNLLLNQLDIQGLHNRVKAVSLHPKKCFPAIPRAHFCVRRQMAWLVGSLLQFFLPTYAVTANLTLTVAELRLQRPF